MTFVQITHQGRDGEYPIWVRRDAIVAVCRPDDKGTIVSLAGQDLEDIREAPEEVLGLLDRHSRDLAAALDQPVDHNPAITDVMVDALLRAIDGRIEELGAAVRPCSRHELARIGLRAAFRVWAGQQRP